MAMACLGDVSCLGAEDEDTLLVSKKGDLEAGEKMVEMHDIKVKPEVVKDYTEEQLSEPHGVAKPFMLEAVVSTMTELIVDKGPEDPELVKERHRHRFDGKAAVKLAGHKTETLTTFKTMEMMDDLGPRQGGVGVRIDRVHAGRLRVHGRRRRVVHANNAQARRRTLSRGPWMRTLRDVQLGTAT